MPDMDGFSATRAIRAMEARGACFATNKGRLPIVALTAHAMVGDKEKCLDAGMDGYLVKPLAQADLDIEIQRQLDPPPAPVADAATKRAAMPPESDDSLDAGALEALRALDKDGTRGVVNRVLDIYLRDTPNLIAEIQAGAAANDLDRLGRAAHSLKSSSRNVGATSLAEICRRLERSASEGRVAEAEMLATAILDAHANAARLVREKLEGAESV